MTPDPRTAPLRLLDGVAWEGRALPGDRTGALLAALVLAGGRPVGEAALVEAVWGEESPARPAKAPPVLVARARTAPAAAPSGRTEHGYRLGAPEAVDAVRVTRSLSAARDAEAAHRPAAARAAVEPLLGLSVSAAERPGPLDDLRADTARRLAQARAVLGRSLVALGETAAALGPLEAAVDDDPDDESVMAALLRAEATERGAAAALSRYERHRARLGERLGTDPSPELQALHAELLVRDRPVRAGLAYDSTELVGRDADVRAVATLVRTDRLTSVVGAGGLGKTRLVNLVGRVAEQPTVHLVELAGVTVAEGVAAEVASVLGVRESLASTRLVGPARRADLVQRLVDQVSTVPSLLILDNCEHLLDAVADLVAVLLARTPRLHVLTTSRAPLGLAAERVYLLPQLSTDDARRLFEERARAARPGVRLDPDVVRRLVARLDGLPLAVELAAAKVRALSVAEIERRLDDRFALLRGGSRGAPERHQTLLAVIDWSWALLPETERALLRRLSVFRDGFTLAAAEAVTVAPEERADDVLGRLTALVDQSLVVVAEGDRLRYRLLETVREFGRDRLLAAGEEAATRDRLRAWAAGLAATAAAGIFGPGQVQVLDDLRAEEGNLLDVLAPTLEPGGRSVPEVAVVLVAALSTFWTIRGDHLRVVSLFGPVEEVLADAELPESLHDALRTVLTSVLVTSQFFAPRATPRVRARIRRLGPGHDPHVRAWVRVMSAVMDRPALDDPTLLAGLVDDPEPATRRHALQWTAQALENVGRIEEAVEAGTRVLDLLDDRDGPWAGALAVAQLAGLAAHGGDYPTAGRLAGVARTDLDRLGADDDATQMLGLQLISAVAAGRLDEAADRLAELDRGDRSEGLFGGAVMALFGRAELLLARGEEEAGLAAYRTGVADVEDRTLPHVGPAQTDGLEPWVVYPMGGAVAAHALWGARAQGTPVARALADRTRTMLGQRPDAFLDYPVLGSVALALALWELGDPSASAPRVERALALLACGRVCGANQTILSLRWSTARDLAERRAPGRLEAELAALAGRGAVDLRPDLTRLVAAVADDLHADPAVEPQTWRE